MDYKSTASVAVVEACFQVSYRKIRQPAGQEWEMDIQVYATLREVVGGKSINVDVPSEMTLAQLLEQIFARHPLLRSKILDEEGNLQPSVHLLVNAREVRYLDGLQTLVADRDAVRIFPPVGGG